MADKPGIKDLIEGETPLLIDFTASWCGPCKMQTPILEQFAQEQRGKVKVVKVDIDQAPAFADQFRVQGVPTLILFKQGRQVWRASGVQQLTTLRSALAQAE